VKIATDHVICDFAANVGADVVLELDGFVLLVSRFSTPCFALKMN
jgi:hypothetical protein